MPLPTPRSLGLAAALCAAALAVPAAAQADSIAYIKDGNVWLGTPDGQRQFQVTTTGQYADVSQADDGTMIALTGVRLHRLARDGQVLADFDTPVSDTRPAGARRFFGPYDPAISPDGTKVAYTYYYNSTGSSQTCFPPQCAIAYNEGGTGVSFSDRQTAWDEPGVPKHSGWRHPSWIDDNDLLLSNPTHLPNADVVLHRLSDGKTGLVKNWFTDDVEGNPHTSGGDVTRDRKKLAYQTGENDSTLSVYAVPSFPTSFKDGNAPVSSRPSVCYRYKNPAGGKYGVPTWSPDGARLAFHDGDGIKVVDVPAFDGGCTMAGATPTPPLVIPGATEPDWGPADVPVKKADPIPVDDGKGAADTGGNGVPGGKLVATVQGGKVRAALRKGLKVSVSVPGPGTVSAVGRIGGRPVAKAAAKQVTGGSVVLTARFTKAARRALARRRSAKVAVVVTFTPQGGAAQTTQVSARLR